MCLYIYEFNGILIHMHSSRSVRSLSLKMSNSAMIMRRACDYSFCNRSNTCNMDETMQSFAVLCTREIVSRTNSVAVKKCILSPVHDKHFKPLK